MNIVKFVVQGSAVFESTDVVAVRLERVGMPTPTFMGPTVGLGSFGVAGMPATPSVGGSVSQMEIGGVVVTAPDGYRLVGNPIYPVNGSLVLSGGDYLLVVGS